MSAPSGAGGGKPGGLGGLLGNAPREPGALARKAVEAALPKAPELVRDVAAVAIAPWAKKMVHLLDELVPIPGTKTKLGLDGIVGFVIPGAGDVITGASSISLLFLALQHRVPTVVIGRMVMNILIDMVVGLVPFAGDIFDIFFKSNRKNLDLIEKHRGDPSLRPSRADYVLVGIGMLIAVSSVAIPILMWTTVGAAAFVALKQFFGAGP